ncbi:MAG: hypothetical protein ACE5JX_06200 [Acidobacteriota bacterium]
MAIRTSPGQFATLPVTPLGLGHKRLNFSHFGDGAGVSSTLVLINPSPAQPATGRVLFFDDMGAPLVVEINDTSVSEGELTFDLKPLETVFLATRGQGTALLTGAVEVESDTFIAGTVLFAGSFGVAGVGSVKPATRFLAPIQSDSSAGVSTGVALANPQGFSVTVTLRLLDTSGQPVPDGTTSVNLRGHGHLARFPEEIFKDCAIDFSSFRGTLEVESEVAISAMAIRTSPGEFATLPVAADP